MLLLVITVSMCYADLSVPCSRWVHVAGGGGAAEHGVRPRPQTRLPGEAAQHRAQGRDVPEQILLNTSYSHISCVKNSSCKNIMSDIRFRSNYCCTDYCFKTAWIITNSVYYLTTVER